MSSAGSSGLVIATGSSDAKASATDSVQRARYLSRDPWLLGLAVALAAAVTLASWYRHATFRSTSYDLGVFDQALWLLAHGKAASVTLIGRDVFLDHFPTVRRDQAIAALELAKEMLLSHAHTA